MTTSPKAAAHPGPRVAFLLGKPPRPSTVFPELFRLLEGQGLRVSLHLPHDAPGPLPNWLFGAALVVQRGLKREALERARALEAAGLRLCNRASATAAVHDRLGVLRRLEATGLRVPRTAERASWPEVRRDAAARRVVVKARDGGRGRGAGVVLLETGQAPDAAPFAGPYLVQEQVPGGGVDHKLYLAGEEVRGLLKRGPALPAVPAQTFAPPPDLAELARRAAAALELDICGVDVIMGPDGPVVVDVNPFPGFRGVPEAAAVLARCLVALLR